MSDALGDKTNGELLNLGEDLCNEASDNVYAMTLAMLMDDDQIGSVTAQAVGCPDRYEAVADEMGWPKP